MSDVIVPDKDLLSKLQPQRPIRLFSDRLSFIYNDVGQAYEPETTVKLTLISRSIGSLRAVFDQEAKGDKDQHWAPTLTCVNEVYELHLDKQGTPAYRLSPLQSFLTTYLKSCSGKLYEMIGFSRILKNIGRYIVSAPAVLKRLKKVSVEMKDKHQISLTELARIKSQLSKRVDMFEVRWSFFEGQKAQTIEIDVDARIENDKAVLGLIIPEGDVIESAARARYQEEVKKAFEGTDLVCLF